MGLRNIIESNKRNSILLLIAIVFLIWTALMGYWILFAVWVCLATSDVIGIVMEEDTINAVVMRSLVDIIVVVLLAIALFT